MTLKIDELRRPPDGAFYTSPARICVTAAGALVECTDPKAARLLVGEGGQIPVDEARLHGLIEEPAAKERRGAENKGRKPVEDKAAPTAEAKLPSPAEPKPVKAEGAKPKE